ncbi:NADH-quinone oxidoreductase subunit NuoG [Ampullimonas aquatilis]|uniref:NADH-quinone oxidoreductase subunit NuoG n=1 Tax=Ampullimonas aquatilis TaxID=1341549 RepID=UPI003C7621C9
MIEIEIDGKKIEVQEGSMIMDAAQQLGTYVPHFCYHKKLSIAANCRMCLVEVEKAPKPLPACATPVTAGMVVKTASPKAVTAQKGVMEFLLINHPLDCPICDQGGECQLQDLAVGYGASSSRYEEEKRVVFNKNLGPLISTDMTRCIHCTRCVRFGQEIAGIMELGMSNRGEHSEIMTFVGQTVDSELSGNMIDLCPVGALTSKPFRYSARTWELGRKRSVSPHDSLGANIVVQTKNNKVMRVLPFENESINECWLSDKDRFAYEGLNSADRLERPMLKKNGAWVEVDWQEALEFVAAGLKETKDKFGAEQVAALVSPTSTVEELYLLQKVMREFGSDHIDFRLHQSDFTLVADQKKIPWLGMPIAEVSKLQRTLVIGSSLRKDHPLIAQRLRQAVKRNGKVMTLGAVSEDLLMPVLSALVVAPSQWLLELQGIAKAVADLKQLVLTEYAAITISEPAKKMAEALLSGERKAIFFGKQVEAHPQFAAIIAVANWIAEQTGAKLGYLTEAGNSLGAFAVSAYPKNTQANYLSLIQEPKQAYVLFNVEPGSDCAHPATALKALNKASFVLAINNFKGDAQTYADVLLPLAAFTETSGTYINAEGVAQSFNGVVPALGEARPGWKILRVLANLLGLNGFSYASSEEVKKEALQSYDSTKLNNQLMMSLPAASVPSQATSGKAELLGVVPIYSTDAIVRRAKSLQSTADGKKPALTMSSTTAKQFSLEQGAYVAITQGDDSIKVLLTIDDAVADNVIRVAFGREATAGLNARFGLVTLEKSV